MISCTFDPWVLAYAKDSPKQSSGMIFLGYPKPTLFREFFPLVVKGVYSSTKGANISGKL